jgi:CPA2 family monovalent cation:H+ antiporter-2
VPVPSRDAPEAARTALPDTPPPGIAPTASPPPEPVAPAPPAAEAGPVPTTLTDHDVIVGYGRVGSIVGARLAAAGRPVLVFEERDEARAAAAQDGAEVMAGNAADPQTLALANLAAARRLFVTIPEAFEAGQVVQQARTLNPGLEILARAHSDDCVRHLDGLGATLTIQGEREIAERMIERAFPAWATPAPRGEGGPAAPAGVG